MPTWSDVNTCSELDKSLELVYNAMNPDCDCVLLCGDFNRRYIELTLTNNTIGLMILLCCASELRFLRIQAP